MRAGFFRAIFHHLLQEGFIVAETVIALPAIQSAYRKRHQPLHLSDDHTSCLRTVFPILGCSGPLPQKGYPAGWKHRFVLHIVANYRRLVGVSDRTFDFLHYRFRIFQQADNVIRVWSDFNMFLVGSSSDITRAPDFGINGSGTLKISPYSALKRWAISRLSSRCCFWSSPTSTGLSLIQRDIRRHQHRIVKQTSVDVLGITRRFILTCRHAAQLAEVGIAVQCPA